MPYVLIIFLLYCGMPHPSHAEPIHIRLATGNFGFTKQDHLAYGLEFTAPPLAEPLDLRFNFGIIGSHKEAYYSYIGLARDIFMNEDRTIRLSPSLAMGYYNRGNDKNLGHNLEFKSGAELAYHWKQQWWFGISYWHISNASIIPYNPGLELLLFSVGIDYMGWPTL